ncbi:MAG: hypothetical protein ACTJHU_03450 [Mycetocola sp.]
MSGSVTVGPEDEASINLVVAAATNAPIWSGISELIVVNDTDGGDLVYGAGTVPFEPGTTMNGTRVGSITVTVPSDISAFSLRTVRITIEGETTARSYPVGEWTLSRDSRDQQAVTPRGDYPASLSECGPISVDVAGAGNATVQVDEVTIDTPGVSVDSVSSTPHPSGGASVTFSPVCDTRADLYTFTPRLSGNINGEAYAVNLPPILAGYLDLSDSDVERIMQR